ncbi:MAG: 50S ribosomal protein L17 [Acidobacteria bacterium]|nr:50S ribosomal protein L17 [Acidobacteriota bacterium]
MRHRRHQRKLGRTSEHRSALFRNQLASIVQNERIVTTLAKAKELRPIVEKMVTLGKDDTLHHRRRAAVSMPDKGLLKRLFEEIGPRFSDRPGGYTRIIKLGPRKGDGAEMAILEFIDYELGGEQAAPEPKKSKKKAKAEDTEGEEPEADEQDDEEKTPKKAASKKSASKKSGSKKSSGAKKSGSKKSGSTKKSGSSKSSSKKSSTKKAGSKKSSKEKSK